MAWKTIEKPREWGIAPNLLVYWFKRPLLQARG